MSPLSVLMQDLYRHACTAGWNIPPLLQPLCTLQAGSPSGDVGGSGGRCRCRRLGSQRPRWLRCPGAYHRLSTCRHSAPIPPPGFHLTVRRHRGPKGRGLDLSTCALRRHGATACSQRRLMPTLQAHWASGRWSVKLLRLVGIVPLPTGVFYVPSSFARGLSESSNHLARCSSAACMASRRRLRPSSSVSHW